MRPEAIRTSLACLLLLGSPVLCGIAAAQVPGRWYQVEVILFRYLDPAVADGETWPPVSRPPDVSNAITLIEDIPVFDDELPMSTPEGATAPPMAFQRLADAELRLTGIYQRLRSAAGTSPLLHIGWRQPGFGDGRAQWVQIADQPPLVPTGAGTPAAQPGAAPASDTARLIRETLGAPAPAAAPLPRFDGVVRLRVGRYLFVDADFVFLADGIPVQLSEVRRMRLQELHYFDHPAFGVLVQVTPFQTEPADPGTAPPDESMDPVESSAVDSPEEADVPAPDVSD